MAARAANRHREIVKPDLGTKERRQHDDVMIGGGVAKSDKRARVISPLERLRDSGKITDEQFAAGLKLALHRYYGGVAGQPKPIILERVDNSGSGDALAATDFDHAREWHEARRLIAGPYSQMVTAFVCDDVSLNKCCQYFIGRMRRADALEKTRGIIADSLQKLAEHWGLTREPVCAMDG